MTEWQPIDTAPKDGKQFLAALSNGWVVILSEPYGHGDRYAWYLTSCYLSIPIERTHDPESITKCVTATHWMPLPEAPRT